MQVIHVFVSEDCPASHGLCVFAAGFEDSVGVAVEAAALAVALDEGYHCGGGGAPEAGEGVFGGGGEGC